MSSSLEPLLKMSGQSTLESLLKAMGLYLNSKNMTALPEAVGQLLDLVEISLFRNQLFMLPQSIGQLTNLTRLDFSENHISSIPESTSLLTQLSKLSASRNQISEIPKTIQELHKLAELNIENNQIQKLPLALGCMESLKVMKYDGNPIQDPPQNTLNRGSEVVINYLQTLNQGTMKWTQGRILLLGEGKVGKSTLVKAIAQKYTFKFDSVCNENRDRTDGIARIDLDETSFGGVFQTKLQVKVWDFGGQDDFQVTHPFFLSSGSLMVIVYSLSQNASENKLDRWIQLLDDFAPGSTVLIVGTHRDKRNEAHRQEMTREIEKLKRANTKKHKYLATDIQVSSYNGEGIGDLKSKIYGSLISLGNVNLDIPKQYVRLKEYFEDKAKITKTMKLEEVQSFSQSSLKMKESQLTTALNFLHDLGSILWYSGQKNLRGIVFLDPLLLIDVFKSVFSFKAVVCNDGFVWKDKLFQKINHELAQKSSQQITPDVFPFILSLLEVFGLGFDINPECMLFPILMNPKAIESFWNETPESHCAAELKFSLLSESQIQKSDIASILVTTAKLGHNSDSQIQYENVITNKFTIVNLQLSKNTQGFALIPGPYIRLLVQVQEKSVDIVIRIYNHETISTEPQLMHHIFALVNEKLNHIRNGLFHKTSFPCNECARSKKAGAFIFTAAQQKGLINLSQTFCCRFSHEIEATHLLRGRVFHEEGFMSKIIKVSRSERPRRPPPIEDTTQFYYLDTRLESLNLTEKLELEQFLGKGAYGSVFKSTLHGMPVAIKILDLIANGEQTIEEVIQSLIEEATLMKECSGSEHIVKLFHTYRIDDKLHLVMELGGQSLKDELERTDTKLKLEEIVKYSKQICQALIFMHAKDLYHEDIKSDNILICQGTAKLADFGIVKRRGKDRVGSDLPTRHGDWEQGGVEHWQAPEVHNVVCKPYNFDSDDIDNIGHRGEPSNVYAFALLLWSMFSRKQPFYGEFRPHTMTIKGIRPEIPADVPYPLQRLIRVCWSQNYKKRPDLPSVLQFLDFYEQKRFSLIKQETNSRLQIQYAAINDMHDGELCEFLSDQESFPRELITKMQAATNYENTYPSEFSIEYIQQRFDLSQTEAETVFQFIKKAS